VQQTGKGCNEEKKKQKMKTMAEKTEETEKTKKTKKTKTSKFKADFVFAAVAAQGGGTLEVRELRMYSVHPTPIFLSSI
jgi:hypothetical protein